METYQALSAALIKSTTQVSIEVSSYANGTTTTTPMKMDTEDSKLSVKNGPHSGLQSSPNMAAPSASSWPDQTANIYSQKSLANTSMSLLAGYGESDSEDSSASMENEEQEGKETTSQSQACDVAQMTTTFMAKSSDIHDDNEGSLGSAIPRNTMNSSSSIPKQGVNSNFSMSKKDTNSECTVPRQDTNSHSSIPRQDANSDCSTPKQGTNSNSFILKQDTKSNQESSISKQNTKLDSTEAVETTSSNSPAVQANEDRTLVKSPAGPLSTDRCSPGGVTNSLLPDQTNVVTGTSKMCTQGGTDKLCEDQGFEVDVIGGYRYMATYESGTSDSESDSELSSECSSSELSESSSEESADGENSADETLPRNYTGSEKSTDTNHRMKELKEEYRFLLVKGEKTVDDLPPIEDLHISVPKEKADIIGTIYSIVEQQVVVEGHPDVPPVDLDSVLFLECGGRALGRVFDVFGPVQQPYYVVRFNSLDHVQVAGIKCGDAVYYAPTTDHTNFVILKELMKQRGSDACNKWGHEVPQHEMVDFSDDEEEARARGESKPSEYSSSTDEFQPSRKRTRGPDHREGHHNPFRGPDHREGHHNPFRGPDHREGHHNPFRGPRNGGNGVWQGPRPRFAAHGHSSHPKMNPCMPPPHSHFSPISPLPPPPPVSHPPPHPCSFFPPPPGSLPPPPPNCSTFPPPRSFPPPPPPPPPGHPPCASASSSFSAPPSPSPSLFSTPPPSHNPQHPPHTVWSQRQSALQFGGPPRFPNFRHGFPDPTCPPPPPPMQNPPSDLCNPPEGPPGVDSMDGPRFFAPPSGPHHTHGPFNPHDGRPRTDSMDSSQFFSGSQNPPPPLPVNPGTDMQNMTIPPPPPLQQGPPPSFPPEHFLPPCAPHQNMPPSNILPPNVPPPNAVPPQPVVFDPSQAPPPPPPQ